MQRQFDIENEKDMQDLWDILPDWAEKIKKSSQTYNYDVILSGNENYAKEACIFKINWHDKPEITRPIQEATEQDIGKLCAFWDYKEEMHYGRLNGIIKQGEMTFYSLEDMGSYYHARRLTKQEIEELC